MMNDDERRTPDAREVDRVEAVLTVSDPSHAEAFLRRCVVGSTWRAKIRTADVAARVISHGPLESLDPHDCTRATLALDRPVPVEPGLRFALVAADGPDLSAIGVVRPWKRR